MAGTLEEDLLGWLEREEERLGFSDIQEGLGDIGKARALLYDELGYDITEAQFEALKSASLLRYEELPSVGITYTRVEQSWGYQDIFRDVVTGRFISGSEVFSWLSALRGL
jgi:hypothetical protein